MSEPTAISVVLEPLLLIGSALASFHWSWWFSLLGRLFAFPLKLVLIPLSFIFNFLLVLLSPVLHILSYILSWINAVLAFIASLEVSESIQGNQQVANRSITAVIYLCKHKHPGEFPPHLSAKVNANYPSSELLPLSASQPASFWASSPLSSPPSWACKTTRDKTCHDALGKEST